MLTIVGGWEPREIVGYNLCQFSAIRRTTEPLRFVPLMEQCLRHADLYTRPHEMRDGRLWCPISNAPMSTSFANSRFLTPWLAEIGEWTLFCDFADMMFLRDPAALFAFADDRYAVMVVKHHHEPADGSKMDDQIQTTYSRKNWSSTVLWNLSHLANTRLTLEMVNTLPGRDLHRFCWLEDAEIGELPPEWNHLVGHDPDDADPALVHFTAGTPETGVKSGRWSVTWLKELAIMDATRGRLST